jgi:hypothetical protein
MNTLFPLNKTLILLAINFLFQTTFPKRDMDMLFHHSDVNSEMFLLP